MMRFFPVIAALSFATCTGSALAEATDAGAADLKAVLQTYLGAADGVVSVAVAGDAYGVALDFAPLIAAIPDPGVEASISPVVFQLTDNGDGTWAMTQDQAFDMAVKVPGQLDMAISLGKWAGTGTFDTGLQTFVTSSTQITDITVNEAMADAVMGKTQVTYSVASARYESTAAAAANGGADVSATYALTGLTENFTMPGMGDGAAAMDLSLTAESYTASSKISGLRPDAVYKLIAFFVANPSEAAIAAAQDGLKAILRDGVPLFDHLTTTGTITAISVGSPMGTFGLDAAGVTVEANGLVADGMVREAFTLSGLTLPAGVVPEWAADLVPLSLSLDFKLSRFNLAAPVALLLDTVDFVTGPADPAAFEGQLMLALMPEGVVDIALAPGGVVAPIYDLGYEAAMTAGMAAMPTGTANVTLKGMTALKTALAAAPEEVGMQAAPMLAMAEGMAKPGDNGVLVWALEMTPEGGMLVNGVDVMAMGAQ